MKNEKMALQKYHSLKLFLVRPINSYNFSSYAKKAEYKKCYQILGVSEKSDQEDVRKAYIALVKKYHPDSGNEYASAEKFQEIDNAFKVIMNKLSKERWDVEEEVVEEKDIQHTAPQHRQYLSYGGFGYGTPFQREKQYLKMRSVQAAENVLQHRVSKSVAEEKALMAKTPYKHNIKTKYGIERLVEDLIQESMSRGEFNNLSGKGKPLPDQQHTNPYVDFVTHKLNQVLIDNGFTPEWITLQKEIRQETQILQNDLQMERKHYGAFPLSTQDHVEWSNTVYKYEKVVNQINRKINKYNLLVPIIQKQMLLVDLRKVSQNILQNGKYNIHGTQLPIKSENYEQSGDTLGGLFNFFGNIFKK